MNLVNQSGWWSSKLTDKKNGEILTWDDYFVNSIEYSKMGQIWTRVAINDTAKMMPVGPTYRGLIGLQLLAAYFPSPFPRPDKLKNQTLDINSTSLMNNSRIILTAWVSKDGFRLRRLDINSSLTITPQILNISSSDYTIEGSSNESTVYNDFGSPLNIEVPTEAKNAPFWFNGTVDWRWVVFGSARP